MLAFCLLPNRGSAMRQTVAWPYAGRDLETGKYDLLNLILNKSSPVHSAAYCRPLSTIVIFLFVLTGSRRACVDTAMKWFNQLLAAMWSKRLDIFSPVFALRNSLDRKVIASYSLSSILAMQRCCYFILVITYPMESSSTWPDISFQLMFSIFALPARQCTPVHYNS